MTNRHGAGKTANEYTVGSHPHDSADSERAWSLFFLPVCIVRLLGRDRNLRGRAMDRGSVFRRCGCRDQVTGRLLGARCPGFSSRRHGTWYFSVEPPSPAGDRRRVRRGGFASRSAAVAALEALSRPAPGPVQGLKTAEWLERWPASRVALRASTSRGYAAHVRGYLVPYLGGIALAELSPADVQGMFTAVIRG